MLYIFGGLPGTGKTTLSLKLASDTGACHVRIDTIEKALKSTQAVIYGPEGYVVAYAIAEDNLRLGRDVVADCVNPLWVTRESWRDVARRCDVGYTEIEVICSDVSEHSRRVVSRAVADGLSWEDVVRREYEPWDTPHIVINTAGRTVPESYSALRRLVINS